MRFLRWSGTIVPEVFDLSRRQGKGNMSEPVQDQAYVVEAEINFDHPVAPDQREMVAWALGRLDSPEGTSPKAQWVDKSRALASNVMVSAPTRAAAVAAATEALQQVARTVGIPLRSVSILSLKMGTL
jgi:hypothetical protein